MTTMQKPALEEIGKKLWLVNFMTSYIGDTGVDFEDGQGGGDAVHQVWADAIFENYTLLKDAVTELKQAILLLPVELAQVVSMSYAAAESEARARGEATALLESIQRKISDEKRS